MMPNLIVSASRAPVRVTIITSVFEQKRLDYIKYILISLSTNEKASHVTPPIIILSFQFFTAKRSYVDKKLGELPRFLMTNKITS